MNCCHTHTHTPTHSHAHTPTQILTRSPPRSPAGKGWVRSNRNPRDLKMTDVQRQVETASSPSQTGRWQQSLISNSGGTIITRAHYHNKPSTPIHILTHERLVEQWVLMMCQSVAVSVSTINTLTASCSSVGNPVASGTSQWRGRSPGDSDTSGTIRNAIVVASKVASSVSEFRCSFSCHYNSQSLLLSCHY